MSGGGEEGRPGATLLSRALISPLGRGQTGPADWWPSALEEVRRPAGSLSAPSGHWGIGHPTQDEPVCRGQVGRAGGQSGGVFTWECRGRAGGSAKVTHPPWVTCESNVGAFPRSCRRVRRGFCDAHNLRTPAGGSGSGVPERSWLGAEGPPTVSSPRWAERPLFAQSAALGEGL